MRSVEKLRRAAEAEDTARKGPNSFGTGRRAMVQSKAEKAICLRFQTKYEQEKGYRRRSPSVFQHSVMKHDFVDKASRHAHVSTTRPFKPFGLVLKKKRNKILNSLQSKTSFIDTQFAKYYKNK